MKKIVLSLTLLYFATYIVQGADLNSPCGGDDWVAYENEVCFKLVTKTDGELDDEACRRQRLFIDSSDPTVSTVENLELPIITDPLSSTTTTFSTITTFDLMYEFLKLENLLPMDDTTVLCEKNQSSLFENLQETILSMQENIASIARMQTIQSAELNEAKLNITRLQDDPVPTVPIGFIYVQLPGQKGPTSIWTTHHWMEITHEYAGLFFRALGEGSEEYLVTQKENSPKLEQVNAIQMPPNKYATVSTNGAWSAAVSTGAAANGSTDVWGLRFALTPGEVRPRNTAVKIYKRIY